MRRYLVVAHRTLGSPELLDAIRDRMAQGPSTFHLLVPEEHGTGMIWDEGQVRLDAEHHLEEARVRLLNEGVPVTGEVGKVSPVTATTDLLRREGHGAFAEITHDTVGSTVARVNGTGDGPLVAVVGHIDEIGLIVHHIDDDGFLWFTGVGGWDPVILVGQRVEIATRDGAVLGVVGKKPIHLL